MSFANAFRRPESQTNNSNNQNVSATRRTTNLIGQAIQATVAQLQQNSNPNNFQRPSDGPIKFRCFVDIKEETVDNKGIVSFVSVPRWVFSSLVLSFFFDRLFSDQRKTFSDFERMWGKASASYCNRSEVTRWISKGKTKREANSILDENFSLELRRCFGMLLAQGRNVRASDMQLLDLVRRRCEPSKNVTLFVFFQESMGKTEDNRSYAVRGSWEPLSRGFRELTHLNEETPKGSNEKTMIDRHVFSSLDAETRTRKNALRKSSEKICSFSSILVFSSDQFDWIEFNDILCK